MSDTEHESLSERELADMLSEEVFSGQPRSVGEALQAADEKLEEREEPEPAPEPETEERTVVVSDEPTEPAPELEEPPSEPTEVGEPELEPEETEGQEDPSVVWAKAKYGDDPTKWAKAAFDQERHISRLAGEKKEVEELASQWYEYAQQLDQSQQAEMPLSSSEEAWVERAVVNPLQSAMQAAESGNVPLYNAVISRIAEDDPRAASAVETEVRLALMAQVEAQAPDNGGQPLESAFAASVARVGIDVPTYGQAMMDKFAELGDGHPYVDAVMRGDDARRDLAMQAVYDLVRQGTLTTRKVQDTEREARIKREGELRRQAAGVVTGGPTQSEPPKQSPFLDAMEAEWRARGQYPAE